MTETEITSKLVRCMRNDYHAMVLNLHGHAMQGGGWPDLYIVHWRFKGFIECKGPKTKLEPRQRKIMEDLVKRGDSAYVLRFVQSKLYRLSDYNEDNGQEFRFQTYNGAVDRLFQILQVLEAQWR
jgi:hypothetical protein